MASLPADARAVSVLPAVPAVPFVRLSSYYFFYYAFMGVFMPYFALYLQKCGFLAIEIGLLMSIQQGMRLLAPNLWGWLADSLGRRLLIMRVAAVLSLAGFASIGLAKGFWSMAAAISMMSFFWTAQGPLAEATVFAHLRGRHGYGAVRACGSFGFIVCVLGMGWWLQHADIHWVYEGGIISALALVAAGLFVPEGPLSHEKVHRAGFWKIVREPNVLTLLGTCMLMTAAHGAFNVFFSVHLVQAGYAKGQVGMLWTLGVLAEILVFLEAPRLMTRFSLKHLQIFALVCAVLRFVAAGWWVDWVVVALVTQCMHGITFGMNHVAAISAISRRFAGPHQAQGQALYGSVTAGAGGILGSVASGWVWDAAGPAWAFTCCAGFAALGLLVMGLAYRERATPASGAASPA
jgi:PPP family 3-phenylpropionic acid transporter